MSDNDKGCDQATETAWCRPVLGKADLDYLAKEPSPASLLELRKMSVCRPRRAAKRLRRSCDGSSRKSERPTLSSPDRSETRARRTESRGAAPEDLDENDLEASHPPPSGANMPIVEANLWSIPSTSIILRPFGSLPGYRRITDRASRVAVHAFAMSELPQLTAAGLLTTPGCYLMTDHKTAYIGESRRPSRRLAKHAVDSAKTFAREVFVVDGCDGAAFDKLLAVDLQFRLTHYAVEAGTVTVSKGLSPAEPDLTDAERATHDRITADALRLLHDAGCRIFHLAICADAPAQPEESSPDDAADAADSEPMAIGVSTVPLGSQEFELRYGGLWARGYWAAGRFVVSAGSEVRQTTNDSVHPLTRSRRAELFAAGVLSPIPGVGDRRRLTVAISFASTSIAAKVLAGAHSAGRWAPRDPSQAVWLA
jgi:hypothetical protein